MRGDHGWHSPSRQTCNAIFLTAAVTAVAGELAVVGLALWALFARPDQVRELVGLVLWGIPALVLLLAGFRSWFLRDVEDDACPERRTHHARWRSS